MQHFFVRQDISGSTLIVDDIEIVHQMKNVLRFKKGDECAVLDGLGAKAKAVVESVDKKTVLLNLSEHEKFSVPEKKVSLYMALAKKPATFELILQKATELGVTDIFPLVTNRCQVSELRNLNRLRYIIREAAEQCERIFLPELHELLKWKDFVSNPPKGFILAGDARMYDKKLKDIDLKGDVNLLIGPEGGLSDEEILGIKNLGGTIFLLGENVLRMETAAIAALAIIL